MSRGKSDVILYLVRGRSKSQLGVDISLQLPRQTDGDVATSALQRAAGVHLGVGDHEFRRDVTAGRPGLDGTLYVPQGNTASRGAHVHWPP